MANVYFSAGEGEPMEPVRDPQLELLKAAVIVEQCLINAVNGYPTS